MSYDGLLTRAAAFELQNAIGTGRIAKIYQPYKYDLLFHIRASGRKHKLLLSANPSYARVHLTKEQYENPAEPPMFCMLLRKHLEGSIIEKIEQQDMDRILVFHMKSKNEIGDFSYKKLIVEIMGRHSNIILVDSEKGIIFDSIKHLSPAVNRHRTVMPGREYIAPPEQHKADPFDMSQEDIVRKIDFNSGKLHMQLVQQFAGLSPLAAKEIVHRAGLPNRQTLPASFIRFMDRLKQHDYTPQIIRHGGKDVFYITDLDHVNGDRTTYGSVSEMLDRFYYGKAERDRVKQQGNDFERLLKNEINKYKKKIKKLQKTLADSRNADKWKLYGELLTAHIYAVSRGDKSVTVTNYYDENGGQIDIPLDPQKSPSENAQAYFQKYQKAKNSVTVITGQMDKTEEEIKYLETLLQQVETAAPKDIEEIREELADQGYLKKRSRSGSKTKSRPSKPSLERYISSEGHEVFVGKNNKQNEYLTNRLAGKDELWFHTKDIPGSHVVIRAKNPSEQTIIEAANLAAYFSKARSSSSVPVDYTLIKNVRKPHGAKPGYVTYDNQQTVFVTPDEDLVYRLKKPES
ncbi:Rqc2 family fibronectin-binding protein [Bacillus marinisedimentorum]|uniref:Rqc2 family fibronectin-binding protein n=1 Tax=Bacillus marinisedimentorum TaxID=1821260 RepID=UPI0007DFE3D9|nr:NFACT RNA binding domain-containing protein [Bacillus marinisedimentorum]